MAISIAGVTYKDRNTAEGLMGWQLNSSNTGLARLGINGATLATYSGSSSPTAGTVIADRKITGSLMLAAGNITVERCLFQPSSAGQGYPIVTTSNPDNGQIAPTTVTIRDCEFDGSLLSDFQAAWATFFKGIANLQRNYIHRIGSGLAIIDVGTALDCVVEGNYVTGLVADGDPGGAGTHSDAFTIRDFSATGNPSRTCVVQNNRFDCNSGNDTGALFLQTYAGNINNVTVQGNLMEGGGYQLGLNQDFGNTYSNCRAINNRMTGTGYGAAYVQGGTGWTQWSENYINNPSNPENKGTVVNNP